MSNSVRLSSPAALRNREPILDVLRGVLPPHGTVLEVASGSGEHVVHFAKALPNLTWQPSDPSAEARESIVALAADEGLPNILAPLNLDATAADWPLDRADALVAINMVHISPWAATLGLLRHAARLLPSAGPLILYGPYRQQNETMAPSNVAFDADLRSRNPEWGIRLLEDLVHEADRAGFRLVRVVTMPANNLSVLLARV
jgi:SAM-dependent methyltransferase